MPHRFSLINSNRRSQVIEKLEDRIALSVNLPVGTNLVENGEFEDFTGDGNPGLYSQEDVAGWSTEADQQIKLYNFVGAPERGIVLQLDGTDGHDSISQQIETNQGQLYVLSLDLREGPAAGETNWVEVSFGDEVLGVLSPTDLWQTKSFIVQGGVGSTTTLTLSEVPGSNDRIGAFIDCVRLVPVEEMSISNSSFEETDSPDAAFFKGKDLPGWDAVGDSRVKNINLMKSGGSDGERFLNLDSSAEVLDRIFQNIGTDPGSNYFISFDIRSASGQVDADNELRVRWNRDHAATFFGDSEWQNVGFFGNAESDLTRLVFREAGLDESGAGDGLGPYIDNLKVLKVLPGNDSLTVEVSDQEPREFIENNGAAQLLSGSLSLSNTVDEVLTGAVVQIINPLNGQNEMLSVDPGDSGIDVQYDPVAGRLRLKGLRSISDYVAVLETLTYENISENPDGTQRQIRLTVDHGKSFSQAVVIDVNVTPVNDRPILTPIADQSVSVLTNYSFQSNAFDVEGDDLTYSISASGTALGAEDAAPTISESGLINWIPQQSGSLNVSVTVSDPAGLFVSRSFALNSVIDQDLPEDFEPFSGSRQLSNVIPAQREGIYTSAPENQLDLNKEYRALIQTDDGEIEILLYDNAAPNTVTSFVNLARDGYYDGLEFFRVESLTGSATEGFIAQSGDPNNLGNGGPGYRFGDENLVNSVFDKPVIAMANQGVGTFSNGSQFFLNFDDEVRHLDNDHTVFGEVTGGLNVLQQINKLPSGANPAEVIRKVTILEI